MLVVYQVTGIVATPTYTDWPDVFSKPGIAVTWLGTPPVLEPAIPPPVLAAWVADMLACGLAFCKVCASVK